MDHKYKRAYCVSESEDLPGKQIHLTASTIDTSQEGTL